MHYQRWWQHGAPLKGRVPNGEAQAFFDNVVMAHSGSECLIWPYYRNKKGYAIHCIDGEKSKIVSRIVCERVHGSPPSPDHHSAHDCGNGYGGCVSPLHVRWASPQENADDRELHGSVIRGDRASWSKLTPDDVREIRSLRGAASQTEIAARFNVSQPTISEIMNGKKWVWV